MYNESEEATFFATHLDTIKEICGILDIPVLLNR